MIRSFPLLGSPVPKYPGMNQGSLALQGTRCTKGRLKLHDDVGDGKDGSSEWKFSTTATESPVYYAACPCFGFLGKSRPCMIRVYNL